MFHDYEVALFFMPRGCVIFAGTIIAQRGLRKLFAQGWVWIKHLFGLNPESTFSKDNAEIMQLPYMAARLPFPSLLKGFGQLITKNFMQALLFSEYKPFI